jgi:two-component system, NtrC family, nitrogen regulation response regulator GlnG
MSKSVWIVDDDQSIRWVLEKALTREGLSHRSFTNPNDVLNALENESPQILISDIRMPRGNGLDLLQHVKASHPNLPVIVMTAYSDLDSAVSSFQGGAFEYLTKPFDLEKAIELIRRAIGESERSQPAAKEPRYWQQETPGDYWPSACDARSLSIDWSFGTIPCNGSNYGGVRHWKGIGCQSAA